MDFGRCHLRDDDGRVVFFRHQYHAGTTATQDTVGVGEGGAHAGRSLVGINDTAEGFDFTLLGIDRVVHEFQLHGGHLVQGVLRGSLGLAG